jgi:hypothetical protein
MLHDFFGIGDLTLLGQYRFYNNRATQIEAALLLGVTVPTAVTDRQADTDEQFDAEFQSSRGSGMACSATPPPSAAAHGRFGGSQFRSAGIRILTAPKCSDGSCSVLNQATAFSSFVAWT